MRDLLLLIICILATVFLGWNVISLLCCRKRDTSFLFTEILGLSYLIGIGLIAIQMFIIGLFKMGFTKFNILVPWVPVLLLNCIVRRQVSLSGIVSGRNLSPITLNLKEITLISFITLQTLYNFFRALIRPIESYDAVAIHGLKSKIMFLAGGIGGDFFKDLASNFHGAHPDYPLLVPLSGTWVYTFLGNLNDLLVKAIFPCFYLAFILIFYAVVKRITKNRSFSLLFTFLLASVKQFSDYATIGYADLQLGIYFAVSLLYMYLWLGERKNTHFFNISLISSILCFWTKNEGMLILPILIPIIGLYVFSNIKMLKAKEVLRLFIYISIVSIAVVSWSIFKNYHGLINENFNLSMVNFKNLISNLNKIPTIIYGWQRELFSFKKWNIFWILFMVMLFSKPKTAFSNHMKYITSAILLFVLGYFLIYIFSAVEARYFVRLTASRFLLHIFPVAMFWTAILVYKEKLIENLR